MKQFIRSLLLSLLLTGAIGAAFWVFHQGTFFGPAVNRITGASLPAGLVSGEGAAPDVTSLRLEAGDWVVLVTDGVAGGEGDQWVRDILAAFAGDSPRELAQAVLDGSRARAGAADDRTVLALRLARRTP